MPHRELASMLLYARRRPFDRRLKSNRKNKSTVKAEAHIFIYIISEWNGTLSGTKTIELKQMMKDKYHDLLLESICKILPGKKMCMAKRLAALDENDQLFLSSFWNNKVSVVLRPVQR